LKKAKRSFKKAGHMRRNERATFLMEEIKRYMYYEGSSTVNIMGELEELFVEEEGE